MTQAENKRLQLLFEDGMSTLTAAVEQLSSALEEDVRALHHLVRGTVDAASKRVKVWLLFAPPAKVVG
jgi:hypothetical protein